MRKKKKKKKKARKENRARVHRFLHGYIGES